MTFTQECSFQWKNSFFVVGQYWCKANLLQNKPAQIRKIIKAMAKSNGKPNYGELPYELALLGLPHTVKGRL